MRFINIWYFSEEQEKAIKEVLGSLNEFKTTKVIGMAEEKASRN